VYNAAGAELFDFDLAGDQSDGKWLAAQAMFVPKGRVYVEIRGSSSYTAWGKNYSLAVKATSGLVETEFNASTATADVVKLGATISGSSLAANSWDYDYFAVDIPADARLALDFKYPSGLGAERAYDFTVYNAGGDVLYDYRLAGEQSDGKFLASQAMFVPKGRVYIRIDGSSSYASWGQKYTLTAKSTPGLVETEFNATTATADVLKPGAVISGSTLAGSSWDYDYFAVDFAANARLGLDLKFPSGLGAETAYNVTVYNAGGDELYDFRLSGDQHDGKWLAAQAMFTPKGRVYVRIDGSSSYATWGKKYTLAVTSTPGLVETETNESTSTADVLKLGTVISGSSLRDSSYDYDYFAVDVPTKGQVSLDFRFPSGLGSDRAYDVGVYNSNGQELNSFTLTADQTNHANGSWLKSQALDVAKGRIYVRIYGSSYNATWGQKYSLGVYQVLTAAPAPKITGTAKVGKVLTAQAGTWAPKPVAITYQWLRNGKPITGATKSSYTLVKADAGAKITVKTVGKKTGFTTVTKSSAAVSVALQALTSTPAPKISGTAKVGKKLTATSGTWAPSPVTVSYQWLRNGKPISGATKSTYTLVKADAGAKITVKTTGKKAGYTAVSKTSTAKAATK